jgi:SOS-response transcriptional repressor LexA
MIFLRDYHGRYGWMPSRAEIARGAGLSSTSVANAVLHELANQGAIEMEPQVPRAIRLVKEAE